MKNKIIKTALIDWKALEWLQPKNFKKTQKEVFEKLKNSLKNNDFIQPFNVWQKSENEIFILDGHHRKRALQELENEGVQIPEMLPANFIECENKKEAINRWEEFEFH